MTDIIIFILKITKKYCKCLKVHTYEEKCLKGDTPEPGEKLGIAAGA